MSRNMKPEKKEVTIEVEEVIEHTIECYIVGKSPLVMNAMSEKARRELLLPKPKKNKAEKASSLKHDPLKEYRDSVNVTRDNKAPTRILCPGNWFKLAITHAALDVPGASKAQIGRLVFVPAVWLPVWGIPQLDMKIVRMGDMNRTPDVRTHAFFPRWATRVEIKFVVPLLREKTVVNLLAAAGITNGVGDGRPQKGKLDFGQFRVTTANDPEFKDICKSGGLNAQDAALAKPEFADAETDKLFSWFQDEAKNRGLKVVA